MAYDIFSAMDAAPGAPMQPAAPPEPKTNVVDIFSSMDDATKAAATQNLLSAQGTSPDRAAQALAASKQTGIAQPAAEENLDQAKQSAELQRNVQALDANPGLRKFAADNPLAVRLAQDEFDHLGTLEQWWTALKTGLTEGVTETRRGRTAVVQQASNAVGLHSQTLDEAVAAKPPPSPQMGGMAGGIRAVAGFIAGIAENAAVGGGAGATAGMAIGGPAGAATGFGVGFAADMMATAMGHWYVQSGEMTGTDGQKLSEPVRQVGAVVVGLLNGLLLKAGAGAASQAVALKTAQEMVQRPTFSAAVKSYLASSSQAGLHGAAFMTAAQDANLMANHLAQAVSEGQYANDTAAEYRSLADAAISGFIMLGGTHAAMRGMSLYGDFRAVRRADAQAEMFKNLLDGSAQSKLRDRDMQSFQDFMRAQAVGSPVENLYVPADKVRELYQGARIDPENMQADPLFPFVPDMAKQLREAADTGGDVVIPAADFAAHLAGSPIAEHLLPDIRVGENAMSMNEAKAYHEEAQRVIKAAAEKAAASGSGDSRQRIVDEVKAQAIAAGMAPSDAARHAEIYASRYVARGERLGMDPYDAYRESRISIKRGEDGNPVEVEGSDLGTSETKDADTQALVDARKRHSVLNQLLECLSTP